jgi:5-methylcytosine-specific restriction endonuclease McrA
MNNRARMHGIPGRVTGLDLRKIIERDGSACVYCGSSLDFTKIQPDDPWSQDAASFDHAWPLVAGGANEPHNLACSCRACNTARNLDFIERYPIPKQFRFRFVREAA